VEDEVGEWRVLFPDAPGCETKGFTLDDAKFAAVGALVEWMRDNGPLPLHPMDMDAVQHSGKWISRHNIDLSKTVVSMIPLRE
jgi:predicted RNase H-like HicB family nuclease